jgi:hypothetical protein
MDKGRRRAPRYGQWTRVQAWLKACESASRARRRCAYGSLRGAAALGLTLPAQLVARADAVIE